jgi:signal transduction histidine kinase
MILLVGWSAAIVALGVLFGWTTGSFRYAGSFVQPMILLSTASVVILLGMTGMYCYMSYFYKDYFYALIAMGWLANAFYMSLEGVLHELPIWPTRLLVTLFAAISFIPFFLASFCTPSSLKLERALAYLSLATVSFIFVTWGYCLAIRHYPYHIASTKDIIAGATLANIPYSFITLVRVGKCSAIRLASDNNERWTWILPATFYSYAVLQLLSPFKLADDFSRTLLAIFAVALLIKIANSISAAAILANDFSSRMTGRSVMEDLGALTASVEHDIRNPLYVSDAILERFRAKLQEQQEPLGQIDRLQEQNRRIFAATEVVRTLRGGADFYDQFIIKTNIINVVSGSVAAIKEGLNTEGVHILRPPEKEVFVRGYKPLLQQAIVNILKNAIEAIRELPTKSGVIDIKIQKREGQVLVSIADNGPGIPKDDLAKLGHFYTTKKTKKPNSGIGLFISSRIMKFHKGGLLITSPESGGTTVTLRLEAWKADPGSKTEP